MRKAILFCLAITLLGTMLISFSACNGILSSLYDEPETAKDFGFITIDHANHSGTVRWMLPNIQNGTTSICTPCRLTRPKLPQKVRMIRTHGTLPFIDTM